MLVYAYAPALSPSCCNFDNMTSGIIRTATDAVSLHPECAVETPQVVEMLQQVISSYHFLLLISMLRYLMDLKYFYCVCKTDDVEVLGFNQPPY